MKDINSNKNIVFIFNNNKCYEFNIFKRFENKTIIIE